MPRLIRFDVPALHTALNARREALGLSWRQLGQDTGLGHHVFGRMKTRGVSVEALAVMLVWLGDTDIAPYVKEVPHVG